MRSSTLITALTRLTTAMAVAAPIVVFGFLHVLKVQPERVAAFEARQELHAARVELSRQRLFVRPRSIVSTPSARDERNRVDEVADALTAMLNSPAAGSVSNLSIEKGAAAVSVTFDARYEQIGRFFWNLRVLPATFDLQSVELTPGSASRAALTRAKVSLLVLPPAAAPKRPQPQMVDMTTGPEWTRNPFAMESRPQAAANRQVVAQTAQPDPVVSSILFSSGRRIALVDGRVVRPGDRVGFGVVRSIEPSAVVIIAASGQARRIEIGRPVIRMARR